MSRVVLLPLVLSGIVAASGCGDEAPPEGDAGDPTVACVVLAHEIEDGATCRLQESTDGCGALWRETCADQPASSCVTLGNVERIVHPDTTCRDIGYTIECGDEWVTQAYVDSWPFGFAQACPETGTPEVSEPSECGRCGTFGSFGRCCGEPYCAGECIGDPCC